MTELHTNGVTAFKIERNVPLPEKKVAPPRTPREPKYPFHVMVAGDSVYLAGVDNQKAHSALSHIKKKLKGSKWVTRSDEGGTRVWRTV